MISALQTIGRWLLEPLRRALERGFGARLNPLNHLGALNIYFFWVVLVSGIWLFIFFETSVAGAYASVEYLTHEQWYLGGVMRSVHRYASDAAVITLVLHMLREFAYDRHRGMHGSYHEVDSSEMAFKIAGSMAFKEGALKASAILLEPIMSLGIITPEEFMGAVVSDLNSRRGKTTKMEYRVGTSVIAGEVPLANMFGYATDLRSLTQGRATFTLQFSHYHPVPSSLS